MTTTIATAIARITGGQGISLRTVCGSIKSSAARTM